MNLTIKIRHIIGIAIGVIVLLIDIFLVPRDSSIFQPLIAVGFFAALLQFWLDLLRENSRQKEIEEKFLEFVRVITGNVRSGTPIPKAIREAAEESNYGALTPHVKKLAYQIEWGVPFKDALSRFAKSTNNKIISRAVAIVTEAEQSGGNIQDVMEGVTTSVVQIKKVKDERRSNAFSQIIQGYIVFFIFIGIMIVLQTVLLPQLTGISGDVLSGLTYKGDVTKVGTAGLTATETPVTINFETLFIFLILIQGFFSGVMIGDFSEGNLNYGIRHSFILMLFGYLIFTIAVGIF